MSACLCPVRIPIRDARGILPGFLLIATTSALSGTAGCSGKRASSLPAGEVRVVGERGTGPGRLFYPRSAAVNARGELCVVDKSGRLQLFDPAGSFLLEWELPEHDKGQPTGINFSRSGELLVADSHYQRILVYGAPAAGPPALVRRWGREGTGPGEFTLVRDIVEDSEGYLYAGDYDGPQDRIEKFTSGGDFVLAWGRRGTGDGEFQRPQGMAVMKLRDGSDRILVADSCNHRVQRFTTGGRFEAAFGRLGSGPGEMKYPYGLAVIERAGGEPEIVVAEWGNNRLQRFDVAGGSQGTWGAPGHERGELATPWDVVAGPGGLVFVVDYGNHRVQVVQAASVLQ